MLGVVVCDEPTRSRFWLADRLARLSGVTWVVEVDRISPLPPTATQAGLVLLGATEPAGTTEAAVRECRRLLPRANVLLLTMGAELGAVVAGCQAGAVGYIARDATLAELAATVSLLPPRPSLDLSARELQVLTGMSHGLSNAEISGQLGVSQETVKSHVARLFSKLRVHDRAHAVAEGLRRGVIE